MPPGSSSFWSNACNNARIKPFQQQLDAIYASCGVVVMRSTNYSVCRIQSRVTFYCAGRCLFCEHFSGGLHVLSMAEDERVEQESRVALVRMVLRFLFLEQYSWLCCVRIEVCQLEILLQFHRPCTRQQLDVGRSSIGERGFRDSFALHCRILFSVPIRVLFHNCCKIVCA